MNDDTPQTKPAAVRGGGASRPTRKLNLASRTRRRVREWSDRVLGADAFWSAAFVLITLTTLGSQRCGESFEPLAVGEIASRDIRATYDIEIEDGALTDEERQQARERIIDVYVHDSERRLALAQELSSVFQDGRELLRDLRLRGAEDPEGAVAQQLGERLPPAVVEILIRRGAFDRALERKLTGALTQVMDRLVVGNKATLEREPAILLTRVPGNRTRRLEDYSDIVDIRRAREELARQIEQQLQLPRGEIDALSEFTASFLDANVYLDSTKTYQRREAAAAAVEPVRVRVSGGDVLIRKGERVTADIATKLRGAHERLAGNLGVSELFALFLLLVLLAFFLWRYCHFHQRGFRKLQHLHALLVMMTLAMLLLSEALLWLASHVVDELPAPFNDLSAYTYLIPLGAGAILVALLANGRIAIVFSAFTALLFGAVTGYDYWNALWAVLVQLCGVYAISTYRERSALLRAGLVVGGGAAVSVFAIEVLRGDLDPALHSLYAAGVAFVGGAVGVGLLISFSLPVLEWLFKVLTDVRLLELSNVNNPLLSQLAVKAPGSYNHSLVVGTLAEEAAKSIGANSLFCRVAACYHDIGKIVHPEYYVENQRGHNPHDRLAPSMSALIIASHVKDGIKLAREAGLPEQIVDIIPQHHGTKQMTYFYEKARSGRDPSLGPVKEDEFRYPGPKPSTREAAIFMLADAVEAAARTVDEPTANRLREMIRKVTNAIVLDGQLDECELTFADLDKIQQAFLRLLIGMYHHRVDYPGFEFGKPKPAADLGGDAPDRRAARSG